MGEQFTSALFEKSLNHIAGMLSSDTHRVERRYSKLIAAAGCNSDQRRLLTALTPFAAAGNVARGRSVQEVGRELNEIATQAAAAGAARNMDSLLNQLGRI